MGQADGEVIGRMMCIDYVGMLQGFWPIRAVEREERIDLVEDQLGPCRLLHN